MHAFWSFGFSSGEDTASNLESKTEDVVTQKGYETPPTLGSLPWQKGRSWASSVLETFRVDTRGPKSPSEDDLSCESSSLEAFRSLTRRAHQLLARQHHRALVSRRAAAHENSYATERLSLALAEAEELEEVLKQHSRAVGGEDHGSPSDALCDAERLTMSGWSTSAGSSTKPSELLCRWESEDAEARQELESLRAVMSQTAGELRSGLLRLSFSSPEQGDLDAAAGNASLCQVLSAALPQLVQSCADAMEVGSSEDDWAGAEASLFEALAQVTSATCDSPSDLDFQLQEDAFPHANVSTTPEEQRDQAALQKLLKKLEALSQRLELEAAEDSHLRGRVVSGPGGPAEVRHPRLSELEAQVQRLVAENQALEEQLAPQTRRPDPQQPLLPQPLERPVPGRDTGRVVGCCGKR